MVDVTYKPIAVLFVVAIVVLGAYFSVNIILAVMITTFKKVVEERERSEIELMIKKSEYLRKKRGLRLIMKFRDACLKRAEEERI